MTRKFLSPPPSPPLRCWIERCRELKDRHSRCRKIKEETLLFFPSPSCQVASAKCSECSPVAELVPNKTKGGKSQRSQHLMRPVAHSAVTNWWNISIKSSKSPDRSIKLPQPVDSDEIKGKSGLRGATCRAVMMMDPHPLSADSLNRFSRIIRDCHLWADLFTLHFFVTLKFNSN